MAHFTIPKSKLFINDCQIGSDNNGFGYFIGSLDRGKWQNKLDTNDAKTWPQSIKVGSVVYTRKSLVVGPDPADHGAWYKHVDKENKRITTIFLPTATKEQCYAYQKSLEKNNG
jgi:hypothetical protein